MEEAEQSRAAQRNDSGGRDEPRVGPGIDPNCIPQNGGTKFFVFLFCRVSGRGKWKWKSPGGGMLLCAPSRRSGWASYNVPLR